MKYEKFKKDGVDYVRITVDVHNVVERPMVAGDKELFDKSEIYVVDETDIAPTNPIPDNELEVPPNEPAPAEPYDK